MQNFRSDVKPFNANSKVTAIIWNKTYKEACIGKHGDAESKTDPLLKSNVVWMKFAKASENPYNKRSNAVKKISPEHFVK